MIYFLTDKGFAKADSEAALSLSRISPLVIDDERGTARLRLDARMLGSVPEIDSAASGESTLNEDETHLYAPYRALSAVYIENRYLDFSSPGVLKASYRMLKGQTVYPNHDADVNQWLGVVAKSWWDEASGDRPGGINTTLKILKKHNERVCDGIREGALHSVSVDVLFEWRKSHPDIDGFYYKLGEQINNDVVRMIATKIIGYDEISLVWQGADRWAKRLFITDNGNGPESGSITNPQRTAEVETGGKEEMVKLSKNLIGGLLAAAGMSYERLGVDRASDSVELDEAKLTSLFKDVEERLSIANNALGEIAKNFKAENGSYTEIIALSKSMAERAAVADVTLKDMRDEALKFAKLAEGEGDEKTLNPALEKSIMNASFEDAKAFAAMYGKKAESLAPLKCKKCGGELSRGSASRTSDDAADDIDESKFQMGGNKE